jgi:hypothetical protein
LNRIVNLFIDFENHQPPATDFVHAHGADCQIWLFHGPHQNKFAADVVAAWQPLGTRVRFIQSSRTGKNSLDFHIAHALGMAQQQDVAGGRQASYVVVSNDSGFDALFDHMRSLGTFAGRAASIAEALRLAATFGPTPKHESPQPVAASASLPPAALTDPIAGTRNAKREPASSQPPATKAVSPTTPTAKAGPPTKAVAAKAPVAKASPAKKAKPAPRDCMVESDVATVIAGLRASPKNRPGDRKALQRHILSLLRNEATMKVSDTVIGKLEASKAISFNGSKVEYKLPKAKA